MAAYDIDKPSFGSATQLHGGNKGGQCMLHLVLSLVLVVLFITLPTVYYGLQALHHLQAAQVTELRAEIEVLRSRVIRLEKAQFDPSGEEGVEEVNALMRFLGYENPSAPTADQNGWMSDEVLPNPLVPSAEDLPSEDAESSNIASVREDEFFDVEDIFQQLEVEVVDARQPVGYHGDKHSTNENRDENEGKVKGDIGGERLKRRERRQTGNRKSGRRDRDDEHESGGRGHKKEKGNRGRGDRGGRQGGRDRESARCRRVQDCSDGAVFAHFGGNIQSAKLIEPHRFDPQAWTMLNVSGTWIEYWQMAVWMPDNQRAKFTIHNGNVTVQEGGYYYIYSQIQYYDERRYNGHAVVVDGHVQFRCTESTVSSARKFNTCNIGGMVFLRPNSKVGIKLVSANRTINMHHDASFFGLYRVAAAV